MESCATCGTKTLLLGADGVCGVCRDTRWRAFLAVRVAVRSRGRPGRPGR